MSLFWRTGIRSKYPSWSNQADSIIRFDQPSSW